jgi:hypothetical protein
MILFSFFVTAFLITAPLVVAGQDRNCPPPQQLHGGWSQGRFAF